MYFFLLDKNNFMNFSISLKIGVDENVLSIYFFKSYFYSIRNIFSGDRSLNLAMSTKS